MEALGAASVELMRTVKSALLPRPGKEHYQFGVRDLVKMVKGLQLASKTFHDNQASAPLPLAQLQAHVATRSSPWDTGEAGLGAAVCFKALSQGPRPAPQHCRVKIYVSACILPTKTQANDSPADLSPSGALQEAMLQLWVHESLKRLWRPRVGQRGLASAA